MGKKTVTSLKDVMTGLEPVELSPLKTVVRNSDSIEFFDVPFGNYLAWVKKFGKPHTMQRNHLARIRQGKLNPFLEEFLLAHAQVTLAHYKGQYYLVDANGRSELWADPLQMQQVPETIFVVVFNCEDERQYRGAYECSDSHVSRQTGTDRLCSVMRSTGMLPKLTSARLIEGRWKGVLEYLAKREGLPRTQAGLEIVAKRYQRGILAVDKLENIELSAKKFPPCLIAAAVVLFQNKERQAKKFIQAVYCGLNGLEGSETIIAMFFNTLAATNPELGGREGYAGFKHRLGAREHVKVIAEKLVNYYSIYAAVHRKPTRVKVRTAVQKSA